MRQVIKPFLFAIIFTVSALMLVAQQTQVNAIRLVAPNATVSRMLVTNASGNLEWATAQSHFTSGSGISISGNTISSTVSGLPSGSSGQTLRNNLGAWVATSFLINNGSQIGIGRTPGKILDVDGPIRSIGSGGLFSSTFAPTLYLENNSASGKLWYLYSNNDGNLVVSEGALGGSGINAWSFEPNNGYVSIGSAGFNKRLNVEGTARFTNLTSDTPTKVAGMDADGDLCEFALGSGLSIAAGVLSATGGGGGGGNYQTWRNDGTAATVQPNANFVSNSDIAFSLTNDGANTETEVTADIPAASVDFSELQNVSTGVVLGRTTAGTGSVEQLAVSTGLSASGGNLTATDPSLSNEGSLTVAAGTGTTSVINSNTSGQTGVTIEAGTGLSIAESGNTITVANTAPDQTVALTGAGITAVTGTYPNFTITSTEVDGSTSNELQTVNNTSDATTHTTTLSNSGGSIQFVEGSNITLTTTGTASNAIVTIAATGGGGSSPVVIRPSEITSDQDNYSPTTWADANTVYINPDASGRAITSFSATGVVDGEEKTLINNTTNYFYLPGGHPDGTAGNRIDVPLDLVVPGKSSITLSYDATSQIWRPTAFLEGLHNNRITYSWSVGSTTAADWGNVTLGALNSGQILSVGPSSGLPMHNAISTSNLATAGGYFLLGKSTTLLSRLGDAHMLYTGNVNFSDLSNSTNRYGFAFQGLQSTTSTSVTVANAAFGIRYQDDVNEGNFQGYTRNGSSAETVVDLGVTVAANTSYKLGVCVDKANSEMRFYINGVYRGRVTSNQSTGNSTGFRTAILKASGTTAVTMRAWDMTATATY